MPLAPDIAWRQIIGARASQQDKATTVVVDGLRHLLVLADGMGGHAGGDIASDLVVKKFCHAWHDPEGPDEIPDRLVFALQAANLALYDRVVAEPELAGMGTTLVAAHVAEDRLHWISVGDSLLWLFHDGELSRLNANHSVAALLDQQAENGEISAEEAVQSPERSLLLEAVTGNDIHLVDVAASPRRLSSRNVLILASDGMQTCSDGELGTLVEALGDSAEDMAGGLLDAVEAHQRPGQDNATLIVLRVPEAAKGQPHQHPAPPPEASTVPLMKDAESDLPSNELSRQHQGTTA